MLISVPSGIDTVWGMEYLSAGNISTLLSNVPFAIRDWIVSVLISMETFTEPLRSTNVIRLKVLTFDYFQ